MKKTLLLLGLFLVANGMPLLLFGQNNNDEHIIVLEYKDYKFFDDEPDYKLFEEQVDWVGYASCESTLKFYVLDSQQNVIEYDLKDALNKNIKKRSFHLPFKVETANITMDVSPNGKWLAFVDENGENLHIVDVSSGKDVASCKMGKDFDNEKYDDRYLGHPFRFLPNNEVLVSGAKKALLFNIEKNSHETITFKKKYQTIPKYNVTSKGTISGVYVTTSNTPAIFTFFVENGKIEKTVEGLMVSETPSCYYYKYLDKNDADYYDKRTGNINSNLQKYKAERSDLKSFYYSYIYEKKVTALRFANLQGNTSDYSFQQQEVLRKYALFFKGYSSYGSVLSGWTHDNQILYMLSFTENDKKLAFFNHTLTDNEIAKQALLTAINEKDIDALNQFIEDFKDSRYISIAKQKKVGMPSRGMTLTDGLVAYYPFDGNTDDMSGNRNNGKIAEFQRNPLYPFAIPELTFETGRKGKCCHYPNPEPEWGGGYRYKNRFINICVPNSNSLKFNDAVSFSFWFKLDEGVINNIRGYYFGMDGGGIVVNRGFVKFFSKASENGQIHAGIDIGKRCIEVYNNNESCSAPFQPDSKWNHAVMVVTNNYFKIYLNGKVVASKNKNMNFNESNKSDLYIGCIPNLQQRVNKYAYNGCIDEFLIYNRELTFAEVEALFKGEELDQNHLAYKRAETASLNDAITYLKNCTNANYTKGIEDAIVSSKTNNLSDIAYCNENYPKLADRLEDKMFGYISSMSDCNSYLKYYSASKKGLTLDDKVYQYVSPSNDVNDCETYLKHFPNGNHKTAVTAQKNEIESYNAARRGGKAECITYLTKYPNGRFTSEIQSKKDGIVKEEQRLAQINVNSNKGVWKLGDKLCNCTSDGVIMATLDQWNEDHSSFKGIITASPGGLFQGDLLQKGNQLWFETNGWHKCLDDEIDFALSHDKSLEAEQLLKNKNMKFKRGSIVQKTYSKSGWFFSNSYRVKAKVDDWNEDFTRMKIQIVDTDALDYINGESIYEGKYIWVSPIGWE